MSFWSGLAKLGGFALAPFTGGASIPIGQAVGGALGAAGEMGKGKMKDRQAQADFDLRAALIRQGTPGVRAGDAVQGDIMAGVQKVGTQGSGKDLRFTGGLNPNRLSGNTRQLGGEMSRQALMSAMGKGGPNDPYAHVAIQQPGLMEKILTGAGTVGSVADIIGLSGQNDGLLAKFGKPQQPAQPEVDPLAEFY